MMAKKWKFFLCALLTAFLAVLVPLFQVDEEVQHYAEHEDVRRLFFSPSLDRAVSSYNADVGQYVWGRTLRPSFAMELHPLNAVQRYTQKKEFVWFGMTAGPWFTGLAILQFNYVSVLTVQLYNSKSSESWKSKTLIPLVAPFFGGKWVPNAHGDMGPSAAGHSVEFKTPLSEQYVVVNFTENSVLIHMRGTVWQRMEGNTSAQVQQQQQQQVEVRGSASLPKEFLGLVFPLGPKRAALVSKFAAATLNAPLTVRLGERQWSDTGYLSMDYTRGLLRRETRWNWASATALAGYGFHLSAGTYDINNKSVENTFYTRGKAMLLDTAVEFRQETAASWKIVGNGIVLRFQYADAHEGEFRCGIVYGNLHHQWGVFDGAIDVDGVTYTFFKVPGAVEEHYAVW